MPKRMAKNIFFFQMIKGKVKAGKVDCQAHAQICHKAGIRAYPTVKFYPYERAKVCTGFSLMFLSFSKPTSKDLFLV